MPRTHEAVSGDPTPGAHPAPAWTLALVLPFGLLPFEAFATIAVLLTVTSLRSSK